MSRHSDRKRRALFRKDGAHAAAKKRSGPTFLVEALEPRVLFSADLAPAASLAQLSGLEHLQAALDGLAIGPAPATTTPSVTRSVAEIGSLAPSSAETEVTKTAHAALLGLSQSAPIVDATAHGAAAGLDQAALAEPARVETSGLVFDLSGVSGGFSAADSSSLSVAAPAGTPSVLSVQAAPSYGSSSIPDPPAMAAPGNLIGSDAIANNVRSILSTIEGALDTAALLGKALPFVGDKLGAAADFSANLRSQLNQLQTLLNTDLAAAGNAVLTALHDDVKNFFSNLGFLQSADVGIDYTRSDVAGLQHWAPGQSVDATKITGYELRLKLGQTWTTTNNIAFDIGLPGLGLATGADSKINGTVGWSFDLAFGVDATNAYLVTNVPVVSLNLGFTLDPAFSALGKLGFLQVLLEEKDAGQHTGVSGTVGASFTASSGGASALSGGTKLYLNNLGAIASGTITPTVNLAAHSNLHAALGFKFEKDQAGNYVDLSDFPSIGADFLLDWNLADNSLPQVGFENMTLDMGTFVEKFVKKVLGPVSGLIDAVKPVAEFMTSDVPAISQLLDKVPDVALPVLKQLGFNYYDGGPHYTWLDLAADMALKDGLPQDQVDTLHTGLKIVFQAVTILHDLLHSTGGQGAIDLGDFYFGGSKVNGQVVGIKDLRLARQVVHTAQELQALIADPSNLRLADLSQLAGAGSDIVGGYLGGLFGGRLPGIIGDIQNALQDLGQLGQQILGGVGVAPEGGGPTAFFKFDYAFPLIENPASLITLMFGQDVDLVQIGLLGKYAYKSDRLTLFGLDLVIVELNIFLQYQYDFEFNLQVGYDTRGIRQFAQSGDVEDLLNGLYLGSDAAHTGTPHPIASAEASVFIGAQAGIAFINAALLGGLGANLYIGLNVEPGSTKVHLDNFGTIDGDAFIQAGILGPLNFKGEIWAQVYVQAGIIIETPFGDVDVTKDFDILPRTTFLKFPSGSVDTSVVYPLAFYHEKTGQLDLYVGGQSSRRFDTNVSQQYDHNHGNNQNNYWESFTIDVYDNSFTISAYGVSQTVSGKGHPTLIVGLPGDGNDRIIVNDFTSAHNVAVNLDGGRDNDELKGGDGGGTMVGGEGDDTITAGSGNDQIAAGVTFGQPGTNAAERNTVNAGNGNNYVFGSFGKETVTAGSGNDTLEGADDDDVLISGLGNDQVFGGEGNDYIRSAGGNDTYDGGGGIDLLDFNFEPNPVNVSLFAGFANGASVGTDSVTGFENVLGTVGNDTIEGSDSGNFLQGFSGADLIKGLGGPDTILGDSGNDTIQAGEGDDLVVGSLGNDSIDAGNGNNFVRTGVDPALIDPATLPPGAEGDDTVVAGTGNDSIYSAGGKDNISAGDGANVISSGAGDDTITAGNGANVIQSADGADRITVGIGANYIESGIGNDTVTSGSGADTILAGDGDDSISAGDGANSILAGLGNDIVLAANGNNTVVGSDGADRITVGIGLNYIDAGSGADTVISGSGPDTILAGDGDDSISASDGANSILGGLGNDIITAGNGNNRIFGGDDADRITVGIGQNYIDAGIGSDTVTSGSGPDTILAGDGDDSVDAADGANSIDGSTGNDIIKAGNGDNTITGADGNDQITVVDGANRIDAGTGDDTVTARDGANSIDAGIGNDVVTARNGNNTIIGSDGADKITVAVGANTITGGAGNDTITAGSGNDTVNAGSDDDYVNAGDGNNSVLGGTGADTIITGSGLDTIDGGDGADSITSGASADTVQGGIGNDIIFSGEGNDTVDAGADNDTVDAGTGDDTVLGNSGDDVIYGRDGNDTIDASSGNDFVEGNNGLDSILGGTGDDSIYGNAGQDFIDAQDGADFVDAGSEADFVLGGTGNDTVIGGTGDDSLNGQEGDDSIDAGQGVDTVWGAAGDDTILGGTEADLIEGGTGNDSIDAGDGDDTVWGAAGGDTILGGAGDDLLDGGSGDDSIDAGAGDDVVFGREGNDTLLGGIGNDSLMGGDGDDSLDGGAGIDFLDGGTGVNTIRGGDGDDLITVSGGVGNQLYGEAGNDVIYGSPEGANADPNMFDAVRQGDVISGGDGNDVIHANGGSDIVFGDAGDDLIDAGAGGDLVVAGLGNDTVTGGEGDDTVYAGAGDDTVTGNAGNDVLSGRDGAVMLALLATGILANLGAAPTSGSDPDRDTLLGGTGADRVFGEGGVDYLDGGTGPDTVDGGDGEDMILGGGGNDSLLGGASADVIIGSDDGNDTIAGGEGNDRIQAQAGNDVVAGDAGDDVVDGGAGDDALSGFAGRDLLIGGAGNDTLFGHNAAGTGDDDSPDTLFGDFGTDANEPGSGADDLYGGGGSDVIYGEGGLDRIDLGTGASDVFGASEAYVAPTPTPPVSPAAESESPFSVNLPVDNVPVGYWSQIAGPSGISLGGAGEDVRDLSLAAGPSGPVAVWAQESGAVSGLYVATRVGGAWTELAGSGSGRGLLAAGESGFRPSIALDGARLVVAWTSVTAGGATSIAVRIYDPAANGGAGTWTVPGGAATITTSGLADDARVIVTSSGPVVLWRDGSHLYAKRFDGASWVEVGAGSATGNGISGADVVPGSFAVATDGTQIAAAWSQVDSVGPSLHVREFTGSAWVTRDAPNLTAPFIDGRTSLSPSVAYHGGSLFLAWAEHDDADFFRQQIYVRKAIGGVWSDAGIGSASGLGVSPQDSYADNPRLAASAGGLRLVWSALDTSGVANESLRTLAWNGSAFAPTGPHDLVGTGIGDLHGIAGRTVLALDPSGRPYLATEVAAGGGVTIRDGGQPGSNVYVADGTTTLASIIAGHTFSAGDLIIVTAPTTDAASIALGAAQSGIVIAGVDGVTFGRGFTINGATGLTIRNLDIAGAVSVTATDGVNLVGNTFRAGLTLAGGSGLLVRDNLFSGGGTNVAITAATSGVIRANRIAGSGAVGLSIAAPFTGAITGNDISGQGTGLIYGAAAPVHGNRIHDNGVGVVTSIDGANALGIGAGTGPNDIARNGTGVQMQNARIANQRVTGNTIGITGTGRIGGEDFGAANLISENGTGVSAFTGLVQFNRFERNAIGLQATDRQPIFDNEFMWSTSAAIQSSASNVRIAGNTIRSQVGDGIRLTSGAVNTDIVSNIIWTDTGIGLNVSNDAQTGFWSDYNTLYAGPTGAIAYWTKSFNDILDWQQDVARFDLHSVGRTSVDPDRATPHLFESPAGLFTPMALAGAQRVSDLTSAAGDPNGGFIGYNGLPNALVNGGFESALTGWTVTAGGSTAATPTPYLGSSVFKSGGAANAVAQQQVDLLAAGYSAAQLDSGALQIAFGGRVQLPSTAVGAKISVVFRDSGGNAVGVATVLQAGSDTGRYQRVFDTVRVPTGARTVEYVFTVTQNGGGPGAVLDDAYLAVVPRGATFDQGVRGPSSVPAVSSPDGRLVLRSPDLYGDWELNKPRFITWDSYGGAVGGAVRIELWQDGSGGPALRSVIASAAADTGQFSWTPSASGLDYGDTGLRVRIVRVGEPNVFDISAEPFTVPTSGNVYYVDDGSNVGDQYTPGATGSNRNTGKLATAPKPNPTNIFRNYDVGAGSTVYVDAGDYPLIDTLQLSGSVDRGLGLDTGFTIQGPTGGGAARLTTAIPGARPAALIDLLDTDFVSLNRLTLEGATSAVLARGGSDNLSASYLTASGQSGDAFSFTTNSPGKTFDHLTAIGAGGVGLSITGTVGTISFLTATGNASGLIVSGSVDQIRDSVVTGSRDYGFYLTLSGATTIEANQVSGGFRSVYINGANVTFGNADLTLGRGNIVSGGRTTGVFLDGNVTVVGNTIRDNVGATGLHLRGSSTATNNIVSGNTIGIELETQTTLKGNRVYGNTGIGIEVNASNAVVAENVVYSNGVGITVYGGSGVTVRNNLVYNDVYAGIRTLFGASPTIINNTVYEPTAGTVGDSIFSGYLTGAVVIDRTTSNASVSNNIIVALAGIGLRVADTAQSGFAANYNLFSTGSGGRVGNWLGIDRTTLAQWRSATGRDGQSRFGDPLFVDPDGADNVLGAGSAIQTGADDDFHVKSPDGSYHGGSLAVVSNGTNGLPVAAIATLTTDLQSSPAIDRGNPATPVGAETAPNGGLVEIGAYGGTAQASRSPSAFLTVTSPDGGETLFHGSNVTVTWNRFNVSGTVDLSASSDGTTFISIASGIANTGSYAWTIDAAQFPAASTYVLRVSSSANPGIRDNSDAAFTISPPVHAYYVNDGSLTNDQYTSAVGSDANDGLTVATPMATLQALLAKYVLTAGDTVYVDTGSYTLSTNVVFTAADSGTGDTPAGRLVVQGPTDAGKAAVFDRVTRSGGFYGFEFNGADYVTVNNVAFKNAEWGIVARDGGNSVGISVSGITVTNSSNGIYIGTTNANFSVDNSNFTANSLNSGSGVLVADTTGATIVNSTFTNWSTGLNLSGSRGTTARNDVFINNNSATGTSFSYDILFDGLTASGGYYGIQTYRSSGVIQNSTVHDTAAFGMSADGVYGMVVTARSNTIYNIGGSNSGAAALTVGYGIAENNVIYNSVNGISNGNIARDNRIYGMTGYGIAVGFNTSATGNQIYNSAIGILATSNNDVIANNTLYDNAVGIQINQFSNGINNFDVINNTIVQPTGTAIKLVGNPYDTTVRNNIISLGATATGIEAGSAAQVAFAADYNLYDLAAGAKLALWSGVAYGFDDWRRLVGFDPNSFQATPGFVDPDGADNLRGVVGGVDHGVDDDFSLAPGSAALNRGDPRARFINEPEPNGDRVDIGAGGNSPAASLSPAELIQLLGQTGRDRYEVGEATTISFRSSGLTPTEPVLFINSGGGAVNGAQPWNTWEAGQYSTTTTRQTGSTAANIAMGSVDAPMSVMQDVEYAYSGNLSYAIPLPDGTYRVKLLNQEGFYTSAGQRRFDIVANGITLASNYDVFAAAGGGNKAVAFTFDVTVTGGAGLKLDLLRKVGDPMIWGGIEIARVSSTASGAWTAAAEVSLDNGATWSTVATGLALDRYGAGSFSWTPTAATAGASGLLRITATNGVNTVTDTSLAPFLIAPAGNAYYVNDGSVTGDVFTTALGSDLNSGKSADKPMASLQALLSSYVLGAGDTVYIDSGTYTLSSDLRIGADDSGAAGSPVRFVGAAGGKTILARTGTTDGTDAIRITGGHDLSFSNLKITGGQNGIDVDPTSRTIAFDSLDVSAFGSFRGSGIAAGNGMTGLTITNSSFHDATATYGNGVLLYGDTNFPGVINATVTGNTFDNLDYGLYANYLMQATIAGNVASNVTNGIAVTTGYTANLPVMVSGNTVTGGTRGSGTGIYGSNISAGLTITGNVVSGMTTGTGVYVISNGVLATNNESFSNKIGFGAGAGAVTDGNRIHNNTQLGVATYGNAGLGVISGNTIYNNPVGIENSVTVTAIRNNLFYGNSTADILNYAVQSTIENNTFDRTGGVAFKGASSGGAAISFTNNIVRVAGNGKALDIPFAQTASFTSDWNLFRLEGGATMGNWGGQAVGSFLDWRFGTGKDLNGLDADPLFRDAAARDYRLQTGSPALDRGDPSLPFQNEPGPNGGRINLGFEGNTAPATQSPAQSVQVLGPNGLDKLEVGEAATITWRSSGLAAEDPIVAYNLGGAAVIGTNGSNTWRVDPTPNNVGQANSEGAGVDTSGVPFAGPDAIYRESKTAANGVGGKLTQVVQVADGTYTVRLNFAAYYDQLRYGYSRIFDIKINGVLVEADFNPYAAAGNAINKAVVRTFTATAAGGQGIAIELVSKNGVGATIAGVQISKANASPVSTALVEASYDNGGSWTTVAAAAPVDAYGNGSVSWTPSQETNGNSALIRVTMNGVQDVSDRAFLITNAGHDFYVNDASLAGDETTAAIGDDLNSGKTPDKPMATLQGLLTAYRLGAGDVVHVDTGVYRLLSDLVLTTEDGGTASDPAHRLTITGATGPGHATVLDRANTNNGTTFVLNGANYVTLSNMELKGGVTGVYLSYLYSSVGLTLSGLSIHDQTGDGVLLSQFPTTTLDRQVLIDRIKSFNNGDTGIQLDYARGVTITNSEISGNGTGIYGYGSDRVLIDSNFVHDNRNDGIYGSYSGQSGVGPFTISNNRVINNSAFGGHGIQGTFFVDIVGNTVTGHTRSGAYGIVVDAGSKAIGNIVTGNANGFYAQDSRSLVQGNRVFNNTGVGIWLGNYGSAQIVNNQVYSNNKGIAGPNFSGAAFLTGNIVYANTGAAVDISSGSGHKIVGNTIVQGVGTALSITGGGTNSTIADNIIWSDLGAVLNISANSLSGLIADFNLYYRGAAGAANFTISGSTYATLATWRTADATRNAGSREGDPAFIDMNGSDNVLGGPDTALGGGRDDDFTPGKFSPAIDAANAKLLGAKDSLGRARRDDPSVADTGTGDVINIQGYSAASTGSSGYAFSGTRILSGWSGASTVPVPYTLPFSFTLFDKTVTSVRLSSAGFIELDPSASFAAAGSPSGAALDSNYRIAPFWAGIDVTRGGEDVYADASVAGQVKFTWVARPTGSNFTPPTAQFSATLFSDGRIKFDYGQGLNGITPVIGIGGGAGHSAVHAPNDGQTNLANSNSILFSPSGVSRATYFDIGALEFQGTSGDTVPPTIVSVGNLPTQDGATDLAFKAIPIVFSEALASSGALSPASYSLVSAGVDGVLDTSDDVAVALTRGYSAETKTVTLGLAAPLADGKYRLTVGAGVLDTAGNALDGNGDGAGGDAFQRVFTIDRSANHAPVAQPSSLVASNVQPLVVTAIASDPDGEPLTYAIVSGPAHGAVTGFNPATGSFTYTAASGYLGPDTIRFSVDDLRLGHAEADISIEVTGQNTAPVAAPLDLSATAGQPLAISFPPGYDLETAVGDLVLVITTQPSHGVLTVTGPTSATYTAQVDYVGADSFAYAWKDTGAPAGTAANVLTGSPATVTLAVASSNRVPVALADSITTDQDVPVSVPLATLLGNDGDEDGDPLQVTGVSGATHGSAVLETVGGVTAVTFTPAAGYFGPAAFSYSISDGRGGTATGTVSVTVTKVDKAPLTAGDSYAVTSGQSLVVPKTSGVLGNDADPEGNPLTAALMTGPAHGALSMGADGSFTYMPTAGYVGPDLFTYRASDGAVQSAATNVSITVRAAAGPVAVDDVLAGREDTVLRLDAASLLVNDTDADGDQLTLTGVSNPTGGAVTFDQATGLVTFTPNPDWTGVAGFDYAVTDGTGSDTGHVTVNLARVNDAPIVADHRYATARFRPLVISAGSLLAGSSDADGDALALVNAEAVTGGTLAFDPESGALVFTPKAGFVGDASLRFTVSDGLTSTTRTAWVTVGSPRGASAPVAQADSVAGTEDAPTVITVEQLLANDSDPDGTVPTVTAVSGASGGTVSLDAATGLVTFTKTGASFGAGGFDYTISDGVRTASAHVTVQVAHANHGPVAIADRVTTGMNLPVSVPIATILGNDLDRDGDALSLVSVTGVGQVGAVIDRGAGVIVLTPQAGWFGAARLVYEVTDGSSTSSGYIVVTATPAQSPPAGPGVGSALAATDDAVAGTEDTPLSIPVAGLLANDGPIVGALSFVSVDAAEGGTAVFDQGTASVLFTPAPDRAGPASFTYSVTNGVTTAQAKVAITLAALADPASPQADAFVLVQDGVLALPVAVLLANDRDPDGVLPALASVGDAVNGTVAYDAIAGRVTFTPVAGFVGVASFTYRLADNTAATVTVQVVAPPIAPSVRSGSDTVFAAAAQTVTFAVAPLLANDWQSNGDPLRFYGVQSVSQGRASYDFATGQVTVTFPQPPTGPVVLTYFVGDGRTASLARAWLVLSQAEPTDPAQSVALAPTPIPAATAQELDPARGFALDVSRLLGASTQSAALADELVPAIASGIGPVARLAVSAEALAVAPGLSRGEVAEALFLGGLLLPRAGARVGSGRIERRLPLPPRPVVTFDTGRDCFGELDAIDDHDLPSFVDGDHDGEDNWTFLDRTVPVAQQETR